MNTINGASARSAVGSGGGGRVDCGARCLQGNGSNITQRRRARRTARPFKSERDADGCARAAQRLINAGLDPLLAGDVLRKLKDAITADPTGFLEGCGQEDVCEWAGVTCSQYTREHQTVTQLNWAQHQLGGTLPTRALNQLTRLQALYLHGNQLHGALPAFHTWPKLKGIYLQDNLLTGTLPRRVAKLTNLQARHPPPPTCQPHEHNTHPPLASSYACTCTCTATAPMRSTTATFESYEQVTGESAAPTKPSHRVRAASALHVQGICHPFEHALLLRCKQAPRLGSDELSGQGIALSIASTSYQAMYTSAQERKQEPFALTVACLTRHGRRWQALNVRSNKVRGTLPTDLHTLTKLKELDVGHNSQLGGALPAFDALTDLTWLRVNDCQLTGPLRGMDALPALKVVRLQVRRRGPHISPRDGGSFAAGATHTHTHKHNKYTKRDDVHLLPRRARTDARTLWVGGRASGQNNALTGALPAFSSALRNMQEFSAAANQLHGTLPAGLGHVSTLKAFDVSDNR